MVRREELKNLAKEQIKGNIGMFFVCMLIVIAISAALSFIPKVGSMLSFIFIWSVTLGFAKLQIGMTKGKKVEIGVLLESINDFGKSILLNILIYIFIFLWSLLLIVPGIIKSLSYSMSFYIMAEHTEMTVLESLNESKRIMEGHKWEFFVLLLSFILWDLLGAITFGFAYIYVAPYKGTTIADYYNSIKDGTCGNINQN